MRAALALALLAGCAAAAAAPGATPSRAEVQAAVDQWVNGCWELARSDPDLDCVPIAPRQVRWARCRPDDAAGGAPRVRCRFSGIALMSGGRRPRFGPDCAYLSRSERGTWWLESSPARCRVPG